MPHVVDAISTVDHAITTYRKRLHNVDANDHAAIEKAGVEFNNLIEPLHDLPIEERRAASPLLAEMARIQAPVSGIALGSLIDLGLDPFAITRDGTMPIESFSNLDDLEYLLNSAVNFERPRVKEGGNPTEAPASFTSVAERLGQDWPMWERLQEARNAVGDLNSGYTDPDEIERIESGYDDLLRGLRDFRDTARREALLARGTVPAGAGSNGRSGPF